MENNHLQNWINKRKERRNSLTADTLVDRLKNGDRAALATAITLIESTRSEDLKLANEIINACLDVKNDSIRIGITGVPGVGKSTFIEAFGKFLAEKQLNIAVLAIDPTSQATGGSILGDKTRMQELSQLKNVFIRPSAAGQTLGGVARKTRETIYLCEAAGFDIILIETVGVGQSEIMVHSMVDFFMLLMLSGAGDELQGIKRGIMEMADALVITKSDGDNAKNALSAAKEYAGALHLFPIKPSGWTTPCFTCSALENKNIDKAWEHIEKYVAQTHQNGWFETNRSKQDQFWLHESLKEMILADYFQSEAWKNEYNLMENQVANGEISAFTAAELLYTTYKKSRK
jgi:LAO/AO transport system kinase